MPFYGLLVAHRRAGDGPFARPVPIGSSARWRIGRGDDPAPCRFASGSLLDVGFLPAFAFYLWYNAVRFGSPLESGYGLASLPPFLEAQRQHRAVLARAPRR